MRVWHEKAIRAARHYKKVINDESFILKVIYAHQQVIFETKGQFYEDLKNTNLTAYNKLCFEILESLKVFSDKWEVVND